MTLANHGLQSICSAFRIDCNVRRISEGEASDGTEDSGGVGECCVGFGRMRNDARYLGQAKRYAGGFNQDNAACQLVAMNAPQQQTPQQPLYNGGSLTTYNATTNGNYYGNTYTGNTYGLAVTTPTQNPYAGLANGIAALGDAIANRARQQQALSCASVCRRADTRCVPMQVARIPSIMLRACLQTMSPIRAKLRASAMGLETPPSSRYATRIARPPRKLRTARVIPV